MRLLSPRALVIATSLFAGGLGCLAWIALRDRDVPEEPPHTEGTACTQDADCRRVPKQVRDDLQREFWERNAYCVKRVGDCNGNGKCGVPSEAVLDVRAPVCGCNGKTYGNDSEAEHDATNVLHVGTCAGDPVPYPGPIRIDRAAAAASLTRAAENAARLCHAPDGPTGMGRIVVTFGVSGTVLETAVSAPFRGTAVGDCVERQFRLARMPPFAGDPASVSKAFAISR